MGWPWVRLGSDGAKIGYLLSLGRACVQLGMGLGVGLGQGGIRCGLGQVGTWLQVGLEPGVDWVSVGFVSG